MLFQSIHGPQISKSFQTTHDGFTPREIREITYVQTDQVIESGEIFQNLLQVCIVGVLLSEIGLRNSDERYQSKSEKSYK